MTGLVLAIDTTGARCGAAVTDAGGRVLAFRDPVIGRGHAEQLMPIVEEALKEAGAGWPDLARIAVSVGPGSFTGLRVGVAAARGLALALGIPAVGVATLEALAEPFRHAGPVLAAMDAKRGEVYLAVYGPGDVTLREPFATRLDDLPAVFGLGDPPSVCVGSGVPVLAERLDRRPDWRAENAENRVDLAALARIALRRDAGASPRPLYLRGADAKPQQAGILARNGAPDALAALS